MQLDVPLYFNGTNILEGTVKKFLFSALNTFRNRRFKLFTKIIINFKYKSELTIQRYAQGPPREDVVAS